MNKAKIVVLVPIRNEEWILEKFLRITSEFADYIIIADQKSTDNSREISSRFPKVTLIDNPHRTLDNASRQLLLINAARSLVPGKRILFALDADEILSADSLESQEWSEVFNAPQGTTFYFEKPDICPGVKECIRYQKPFALAYVDDDITHKPSEAHSTRVPINPNGKQVTLNQIKFLHYGITRPSVQASKMRMYAIRENLGQDWSIFRRRRFYAYNKDYRKGGKVGLIEDKWLKGWSEKKVDVRHVVDVPFSWYDFEALDAFKQHGCKRFWLDTVWNVDWEACRLFAIDKGMTQFESLIIRPPNVFYRLFGQLIDCIDNLYMSLRKHQK